MGKHIVPDRYFSDGQAFLYFWSFDQEPNFRTSLTLRPYGCRIVSV